MESVETMRPFGEADLGARIRVLCGGGREVAWDGHARVDGNRLLDARTVNILKRDNTLERDGNTLSWRTLTTGSYGGLDAVSAAPDDGWLHVDTPLVSFHLALSEIGLDDQVFGNDGMLPRRVRVFRLPNRNLSGGSPSRGLSP